MDRKNPVIESVVHLWPVVNAVRFVGRPDLPSRALRAFSVFALVVFSSAFLAAEEDDEIFELSPFLVQTTDDRGYLSTNTISGTSLNMPIRDIPMPLEVINQEFIEDLQATDLDEALAYSSGVFTETFASTTGANVAGSAERSPSAAVNVNDPFANALSIRGYSVPNQQRFGFRVGGLAVGEGFTVNLGGATDMSNASRLEVVRGPASLLYGVNVLSGIVNIIPKRPMASPRFSASASVGSYGFRRTVADYTGPIVKDLIHFRIIGAYQEADHHTDFQSDRREYITGQLEILPFKRTRILAEVQYADQRRHGIGPQFFTASGNEDFRNPFGEQIRWGRDEEDMRFIMDRDDSYPRDVFLLRKENPLVPYSYGDLGRNYRISGPDTYTKRRELNAMLLVQTEPVRNLNLEFGGYYTKTDQEGFNVNMSMPTDSEGFPAPSDEFPILAGQVNRQNLWIRHPEVLAILGGSIPTSAYPGTVRRYGLDEILGFRVTADDIPNLSADHPILALTTGGVGEVFVTPDLAARAMRPEMDENETTLKFQRYYWMKRPTESESVQLRLRGAYALETGNPLRRGDDTMTHTFIGGVQYTKDQFSIVQGNPGVSELLTSGQLFPNPDAPGFTVGRFGEDPYLLRSSIYDFSPIRYNNEPLAFPGNLSTNLGRPLAEYVNDPVDTPGRIAGYNIARSGWKDVDATYRGYYGIYQAQMFQDRITFIGGIRRDEYKIIEEEQIRLIDGIPAFNPANASNQTDLYFGSQRLAPMPFLIPGTEPYTEDRWFPELPENLNREIQREMELMFEGLGPQGTRRQLFDQTQSFTTKTAGLSARITDDLSMYVTYSEGVFPNQGLLDGLNNPIPAEETVGKDIGMKFDLFDGRISGTISVFQIERKNASWNFNGAPNPRSWYGGDRGPDPEEGRSWGAFDARSAVTADGIRFDLAQEMTPGMTPDRFQGMSYGVNDRFFREAWQEFFGTEAPEVINTRVLDEAGLTFVETVDVGTRGRRENAGAQPYYWVDVSRDLVEGKHVNADGIDVGMMMKAAFEAALQARDFDGYPIFWPGGIRQGELGAGNNPSNTRGALVTFEERARGVDGQFILSPLPNYQTIFTFSYQNREVVGNGFNLAPLIDPMSGEQVPGSRYDYWVFILGADNFEDPTDPTTFDGTGINGMDLSFVPNWNASLWQKYTFVEGPLEGLHIAGGAKFFGSAPTSVAIGGIGLDENRFPTPPTPSRIEFDGSIGYRFDWGRTQWRINLNVRNLLNTQRRERVVEYRDPNGPVDPVFRRTVTYAAPRSFRLQVGMSF